MLLTGCCLCICSDILKEILIVQVDTFLIDEANEDY